MINRNMMKKVIAAACAACISFSSISAAAADTWDVGSTQEQAVETEESTAAQSEVYEYAENMFDTSEESAPAEEPETELLENGTENSSGNEDADVSVEEQQDETVEEADYADSEQVENENTFDETDISEEPDTADTQTDSEYEQEYAAEEESSQADDTSAEAGTDEQAEVTEEVQKQPTFDHEYEFNGDYTGQDFSSCRLLIATEDDSIFTWDTTILSYYNGIYLAQFNDETETRNAFSYYYSLADFVEADMELKIATDDITEEPVEETDPDLYESEDIQDENTVSEDTAEISEDEDSGPDMENVNNNDDAISTLNKLTEETPETESDTMIALIDTGIPADASYIEAASVIGDTVTDDNGHGTAMYDLIMEEDPEASVISIKALDADGVGSVSDLYAAIEYAVAMNASIINLSVSAYLTEGSEVIQAAISDAYENGAVVVGAAGNNGKNAMYFIPGSVEQAIIVGACDQDGNRVPSSNYGDSVDYNVTASATSEAAAKLSGFISANGIDGIGPVLNKGKIFETDYKPSGSEDGGTDNKQEDKKDEKPEVTTDKVKAAADPQYNEPSPGGDWGSYTSGTNTVPDSITVTDKRYIEFNKANSRYGLRSGMTGVSHTGILTVKDTNGNTGIALCCDPEGWSFDVGQKRGSIVKVTSAKMVKALYYAGLSSAFGTNHAKEIGGTRDAGILLAHFAASYFSKANKSHLFAEPMILEDTDYWSKLTPQLQQDVRKYITNIASYPTPTDVTAYMIYPRPNKMLDGGQPYLYLVKNNQVKIRINKYSRQNTFSSLYPNSYNLKNGGEFRLYTNAAATTLAKTVTGENAVLKLNTLKTADNGTVYAVSNTLVMKPGTYYAKEISAPTGFRLGTNAFTADGSSTEILKRNATTAGNTYEIDFNNTPLKGGNIYITKKSSLTYGPSVATGAVFRVRYYDSMSLTRDTVGSATAKHTWYITTSNGVARLLESYKASGYTSSDFYSAGAYPLGTYLIDEVAAPTGYLNAKTGGAVNTAKFSAGTVNFQGNSMLVRLYDDNGTAVMKALTGTDIPQNNIVCSNTPVIGGVKIAKLDAQSPVAGDTSGAATLQGAVFEIVNNNNYAVCVDKNTARSYAKGEVVKTITTDVNGVATTSSTCLEYGSYIIREKTAPTGYVKNTSWSKTFTVTSNGTIVDLTGTSNACKDTVIRGNFSLKKVDDKTGAAMAGVQFKIKSKATGEEHLIMTDSNGEYSSAKHAHSKDTNKGTAVSGLWFGKSKKGNNETVNDSLGALPYGTYTYTEVKGTANAAYNMLSGTFTISSNGTTVNVGTLRNKKDSEPNITTTLTTAGGEHYASEDDSVLKDVVSYTGFDAYVGQTLKFEGKLINKKTNIVIATKEVSKSITSASGSCTVQFDALSDQAIGQLMGSDVVAYQRVYHGSTLVESHEDPAAESQTVHYPKIATSAKNTENGSKTVLADSDHNVQITDTITYTNLKPDTDYQVKGYFYDVNNTKTALLSKTQTVHSSSTGSGAWDISYSGNITNTTGRTIVAFENVYDSAGTKLYVTHRDKDDTEQQIKCPAITTEAKDSTTGTKTVSFGDSGTTTLTDTVTYYGLVPGHSYRLEGSIMDKAAGEPIEVTGTAQFQASADGSGTTTNTFTVSQEALAGKIIVMYEDLYDTETDALVASHKDINDAAQTMYVPVITTNAASKDTGKQYLEKGQNQIIKDTVSYTNFAASSSVTYKIIGGVINKTTGEETTSQMVNASGSEIRSTEFSASSSNGTVDVYYKVNTSDIDDPQLVVFERIYQSVSGHDILVAEHYDLNDAAQTLFIPKIETDARDLLSDSKTGIIDESGYNTIVDTVTYGGLVPGKTYEITGAVMKKGTTAEEIQSVIIDAKAQTIEQAVTAQVSFTSEKVTFVPSQESGEIYISFRYNASQLRGETIVIFEDLFTDETNIATHHDINDTRQTIYLPNGYTQAKSTGGSDKYLLPKPNQHIEDTFYYENLIPGEEYKITGKLMVKGTSAETTTEHTSYSMVNANDEPIEQVSFTPETADGSVKILYKLDASGSAGKEIVVYEILSKEDNDAVIHENFADEAQTVRITKVSTKAVSKDTGKKLIEKKKDQVIKDTVTYSGFIPDSTKTYKIIGGVLNKKTGAVVPSQMVNASGVSISSTELRTSSGSGTIDVYYKVDASNIDGTQLVMFERIYQTVSGNDILVAEHYDINDADQTIIIPGIETDAADLTTGTKAGTIDSSGYNSIVDRITYTGLVPGQTYEITGAVMKKASTPIEIDSVITAAVVPAGSGTVSHTNAKVTFTPVNANGTVDVTFKYSAESLRGEDIVMYEDLYSDGETIATHHDINDTRQTVYLPNGYTQAKSTGGSEKYLLPKPDQHIEDTFYYENLVPGQEYKITGKLMVKGTSAATTTEHTSYSMVNDKDETIQQVTFTPQTKDGSVKIRYKLDASGSAGKEIVVYEKLLKGENNAVIHENFADEAQTVRVPKISTEAADKNTGKHLIEQDKDQIIKDTVTFSGFTPENTTVYKIVGGILNKKTGSVVPSQMVTSTGVPVSSTGLRTPTGSGTIDVYYKVDASNIDGGQLVMFERIYQTVDGKDELIAEHYDINDSKQTINVPGIVTDAADLATGTKAGTIDNNGYNSIVDKITYTGLVPGQAYEITGTVMKKGLVPAKIDSVITAATVPAGSGTVSYTNSKVTFTPAKADGIVNVTFRYSAESLRGEDIVMYEDLYSGGESVAVHHDINDTRQTVYLPKGYTRAKAEGDSESYLLPAPGQHIEDTFYYENLVPGQEYKLTGKLMVKGTSAATTTEHTSYSMVNDNDETIQQITFTPTAKDGSVKVRYKIDASVSAGKDIVVYETLATGNNNAIVHENFADEAQTVPVKAGKAQLIKTDRDTGKPVQGAVYGVYKASDNTLVKQLDPTDAAGKTAVDGLAVGNYYFKEITAPADYKLNPDKINFAITAQDMSSDPVKTVNSNTTDEHEKGKLVISKTISGTDPDRQKEFTFTVVVKDSKGTGISGTYNATKTIGTAVSQTPVTFANGTASVKLKHSESIEITLPSTYKYTVTENPDEKYVVETPESGKYEGTIVKDKTATAAFTNKFGTSTLTVKKTVTGNMGSRDKEFSFTLTLKDKTGKPLSGTYPYTGTKTGNITLDKDGKARFTLAHNDSVTFANIPVGASYTVAEDDYSSESYKTTSDKASGVIPAGGITASFVNAKNSAVPTGIYTKLFGSAFAVVMAGLLILLINRKRREQ